MKMRTAAGVFVLGTVLALGSALSLSGCTQPEDLSFQSDHWVVYLFATEADDIDTMAEFGLNNPTIFDLRNVFQRPFLPPKDAVSSVPPSVETYWQGNVKRTDRIDCSEILSGFTTGVAQTYVYGSGSDILNLTRLSLTFPDNCPGSVELEVNIDGSLAMGGTGESGVYGIADVISDDMATINVTSEGMTIKTFKVVALGINMAN